MKTTLITSLILLTGALFAQTEVAYTYDDAGNRIKRESNTTTNFIPSNNNNESAAMEDIAQSGIQLDAHPNPASENTSVAVIIDPETVSEENKTALASGVTMQLADVTGKVLKTQKGNSLEQTFDMQGLAKGVYFIKVFTKSGQLVGERKVVKE
jgi:hypothetical protein